MTRATNNLTIHTTLLATSAETNQSVQVAIRTQGNDKKETECPGNGCNAMLMNSPVLIYITQKTG